VKLVFHRIVLVLKRRFRRCWPPGGVDQFAGAIKRRVARATPFVGAPMPGRAQLERELERFVLDLDLDWDAFHNLLFEAFEDVACDHDHTLCRRILVIMALGDEAIQACLTLRWSTSAVFQRRPPVSPQRRACRRLRSPT
jgi:hypothetical protein